MPFQMQTRKQGGRFRRCLDVGGSRFHAATTPESCHQISGPSRPLLPRSASRKRTTAVIDAIILHNCSEPLIKTVGGGSGFGVAGAQSGTDHHARHCVDSVGSLHRAANRGPLLGDPVSSGWGTSCGYGLAMGKGGRGIRPCVCTQLLGALFCGGGLSYPGRSACCKTRGRLWLGVWALGPCVWNRNWEALLPGRTPGSAWAGHPLPASGTDLGRKGGPARWCTASLR